MCFFVFGTGNLQAQNNVNMLPDSGNVGIGTTTPNEKFEVQGNANFNGHVRADSMKVNKSLQVDEKLLVGDSLEVEGVFSAKQMKGTEIIESDTLVISRIMSPDSLLFFGDSTMIMDVSNNRIYDHDGYGISMISPSSTAGAKYSMAAGEFAIVAKNADNGFAFGYKVRSLAPKSFVIGTGGQGWLSNTTPNSLMVGFNTTEASFFVGPNIGSLKTGNVGVSTTTPNDKLQIGDGVESITFGSALNDDSHWLVGYMGMNVNRIRTGNGVVSNWVVEDDGTDSYGGGVIATDAAGNMFIIPVKKTGDLNYTMTDAALIDRRMVGLYPGDYNESTGEIGEGYMKVQGNIVCRDLEVTLTGWWDNVFKPDYKLMSIEELELLLP